MQVRVLPTMVMFEDGVAIKRLVGFDDLGGEEFKTSTVCDNVPC